MQLSKQFTIFTLACLPASSLLFGLQTRTDRDNEQDRFTSDFPSDPVENTSGDFLLDGFDLSGVGWDTNDTRKGFVMISPLHFLAATHFAPNSSDSITFNNRNGDLVTIGVNDTTVMANDDDSDSDLTLGTLDRQITSGDEIGFLPVANLASEAGYTTRQIFVYGQTPKVGIGDIGTFQDFGSDPITSGSGINESRTYQFTYNDAIGNGNDAFFEIGDSGSPSFTVIDGQLAITGTHSALVDSGTTKLNYDIFVPNYIDELNTAMSSDSGNYQVNTVPEPSQFAALAAIASAFAVTASRRRIRRTAS